MRKRRVLPALILLTLLMGCFSACSAQTEGEIFTTAQSQTVDGSSAQTAARTSGTSQSQTFDTASVPTSDISSGEQTSATESQATATQATQSQTSATQSPETTPQATQSQTSATQSPETTPQATQSQTAVTQPPETSAGSEKAGPLEIHFIDVGQADAAVVICGGAAMMIDGGNTADSSLIYSYLNDLGIDRLDYIVCTHAHEDHVGGLAGALNKASAGTVFCPQTEYDSKAFSSFKKYLDAQSAAITLPTAGQSFMLGGAKVTILAPISTSDSLNNTSIVLRIVYGDTSFLFAGDAEREEEQDILASGAELSSTVLKVGHHGSDSSTTYPFLREVMPEYAVISVGEGNSYGHPDEGTLSRLRDAGTKVFRTDMQGHIVCRSDGKTVSFTVAENPDADTLGPAQTAATQTSAPETALPSSEPPPATEDTEAGQSEERCYVLNNNTKKFHYPSCGSVKKIAPENYEEWTGSRQTLIDMGYDPCGNCKP